MNAVGIICEYNPFHNGHMYHLKKVAEIAKDDVIILVMSGHFMQRGEMSICNKWDKTKIAIENGIDLVIELPFVFASQSADIFAKGSIQILEAMHVSKLIFGSESDEVDSLQKLVEVQQRNPLYDEKVHMYLEEGLNYPTAMGKALIDLTGKTVVKPNDLLGLSYIKAISTLGSSMQPITIQRTHSHHDPDIKGSFASGSAIRKMVQEGLDISTVVPSCTLPYIHPCSTKNYFPLLKYKILTESDSLQKYQTVDEGMNSRIRKAIMKAESLEELIQLVKTKRYTYNKIARSFTHILCNFTKKEADLCKDMSYIRVLGFSNKGRSYLKQIKEKCPLPIISKFGDIHDPMLDIEQRVTSVYAVIANEKDKVRIIENEYKHPPIH